MHCFAYVHVHHADFLRCDVLKAMLYLPTRNYQKPEDIKIDLSHSQLIKLSFTPIKKLITIDSKKGAIVVDNFVNCHLIQVGIAISNSPLVWYGTRRTFAKARSRRTECFFLQVA